MKNYLKLTFGLVVITLLVGSWHYNSVKADSQIPSLVLQNIEALAEDESSMNVDCIGIGSVDCPGTKLKVKYVISGYGL